MLSAMQSASYKSSLENFDRPREEEDIQEEIYSVEDQIRNVMRLLDNWRDEDPQSINLKYLFYDFELIEKRLPGLMDDLENLEEEMKESQKYYSSEPDCMAIAKEDF
ncbi:MAG: hypothetical protein BWY45_02993 [Euryarchaeota archaeon ADurb.Bin294]|nr:MAG: hypothetical protein BWY45_02993 [Euryarchaeota archaeon ADurb.Bin294]